MGEDYERISFLLSMTKPYKSNVNIFLVFNDFHGVAK